MNKTLRRSLLAAALSLVLSPAAFAAESTHLDNSPASVTGREIAKSLAVLMKDPDFQQAFRERLASGPVQLHEVLSLYEERHGGFGNGEMGAVHGGNTAAGTGGLHGGNSAGGFQGGNGPVSTGGIRGGNAIATELRALDKLMLERKGLADVLPGAFEIRLHIPDGVNGIPSIAGLPVAAAPHGHVDDQTEYAAYDTYGNETYLNANADITAPLLIVDINGKETVRAGMEVMTDILRANGLSHAAPARRTTARAASTTDPRNSDLTILRKIRLQKDHEPASKGPAEIFALVSGINKNVDGAEVMPVNLPWLQHDKTVYQPNMPIVYWSNFALDAVNIQLMEDDGNLNFKDFAQALAKSVTAGLVLNPITAPFAPIGAIADKIIESLPTGLFGPTTDYVDTFYNVRRYKTYNNLPGSVVLKETGGPNGVATFDYEAN
ncbi:hypothetical protein FHW69_000428 [Luteibacter sp. Sphag1AF]|uniref:DUF3103 family protein n=1 Tax=Luteibacter sp. Sphag1AF TaxID=2587031 RepID=UPI00160CB6B4|nr:DUF3103 family protein [Luteibacter sp. Sphag1AF]MBB3225838.1 hypothetical protein [Luteibacter sp. Sphag1AF]